MNYISLERGKNKISVNRKMFGPTDVYLFKTQPDICAKTCAPHVIIKLAKIKSLRTLLYEIATVYFPI